MTALAAAAAWFITATIVAMTPSRDYHWRAAYVLIAIGAPILLWVYASAGFWPGNLVLLGGLSVLRWPVIYLVRWVRRCLGL